MTTPEQIEAVALAMCDTEWGEGYWDELTPYARREYKRQAASAINAMRPFIRAEALEEAAKVVGAMSRTHSKVREDVEVMGIKGTVILTLNNGPVECAAAIRALKDI